MRGLCRPLNSNERRLYYVLGDGRAIRYPVGVGKNGKRWSGATMISRKYLRPDWAPPPEVRRDKPNLPDLIRGGSAENPLGAAVLILVGGKYGIHSPTSRNLSAASYPMAASVCITKMSLTSTRGSASAPACWCNSEPRYLI
jgi:hypothetical protein